MRVDARLTWHVMPALGAYFAADIIFATKIATTTGADGVVSYDAPRRMCGGLTFAR